MKDLGTIPRIVCPRLLSNGTPQVQDRCATTGSAVETAATPGVIQIAVESLALEFADATLF